MTFPALPDAPPRTTTPSACPLQEPTLVLGVGNPLMGDDGAGMRVVEMLAERQLPSHMRLEAIPSPAWELPNWLQGWQRVIIVDAAQMNLSAGEWRRFELEEVRFLSQSGQLSIHQPGLAQGLELAQALDLLPPRLTFYGIQPAQVGPLQPLSPAVEACLPQVVESIWSDLGFPPVNLQSVR